VAAAPRSAALPLRRGCVYYRGAVARRSRHRKHRSATGYVWLGLFFVAVAVVAVTTVSVLHGGRAATTKKTAARQTPHSTPTKPKPVVTSVSIVAGGDLMADQGVASFIQTYGANAVLAGVEPLLSHADLAFVNLESPLSDKGTRQAWKDVTFEGDPRMAPALASAGVDVVTMANNHAMDYGGAALLDTISRLKRVHVAVVGAGASATAALAPAIIERHGIKVAFLGYSDVLPAGYVAGSGPGIAPARSDMTKVIDDIRAAKAKADFVVVAFHWGVEYDQTPNPDQVAEGHAAIDAGADLVMASHPHVLEGVEAYHGGLIAYSLGDFVFEHSSRETGETVLITTDVSKTQITAKLTPVYLSSQGIPKVVKGYDAAVILKRMQDLSRQLHTTVVVTGDTAMVSIKRPR
jgi:poly-gamma-glutamate capsule biosynthesis protein CapA/YwtB (metallophosphatase superfamily)